MERKPYCLAHCRAACCGDMYIKLSETERAMLESAGQHLEQKSHRGEDGKHIFDMAGRCVMLKGNKCKLHGKKEQPSACRTSLAGSEFCKKVRIE